MPNRRRIPVMPITRAWARWMRLKDAWLSQKRPTLTALGKLLE
jgi:hypothetical protein